MNLRSIILVTTLQNAKGSPMANVVGRRRTSLGVACKIQNGLESRINLSYNYIVVEKIVEKEVITTTDSAPPAAPTKKAAKYSAHSQFVYLIFGIAEGLIGIRFVFKFLGANPGSPIVRFIYSVSEFLMAPFRFIFPTSQVEGAVFEWTALVAIIFYIFFSWVLDKVINILYAKELAE